MTQSMTYTMPIMFGFVSLQFPAGLSIYFILSNVIGIAQGFYMRRTMPPPEPKKIAPKVEPVVEPESKKATSSNGRSSGKKKSGSKKRRSAKR